MCCCAVFVLCARAHSLKRTLTYTAHDLQPHITPRTINHTITTTHHPNHSTTTANNNQGLPHRRRRHAAAGDALDPRDVRRRRRDLRVRALSGLLHVRVIYHGVGLVGTVLGMLLLLLLLFCVDFFVSTKKKQFATNSTPLKNQTKPTKPVPHRLKKTHSEFSALDATLDVDALPPPDIKGTLDDAGCEACAANAAARSSAAAPKA
jgi:hypothetical protein